MREALETIVAGKRHRPSQPRQRRWIALTLALVLAVTGYLSIGAIAAHATEAAKTEITVLALGDSLTAGYGLRQEDSLPARLDATLRRNGFAVRVINSGVSGDKTAGGLARLEWLLADAPRSGLDRPGRQ